MDTDIVDTTCTIHVGMYEYCAEEILGEGGYGTVFKGIHSETRKNVALKRMPSDKFKQNEVDSIVEAQCPYVVSIFDVVKDDDLTYMIMELCDTDLERFMQKYGRLTEVNVDTVGGCLARGYSALHENNIVHRDIKPQNILLKLEEQECENEQPRIKAAKLADFGLSRFSGDNNTEKGNLAGTLFYMAPEVGANIVEQCSYDESVDMWSLGVVLYECICGVLPFNEQQLCRLFLRAMEGNYCGYEPPSMPDYHVGHKYQSVVEKLLSLNPSERLNPLELNELLSNNNNNNTTTTTANVIRCSQEVQRLSLNSPPSSSNIFSRILSSVAK